MMRADKSLPYEHHESVRDMQDAIIEVVRRQLIDDIRQSGVFSVMCDESTDVSTEKTFIFYVRTPRADAKFLEVTELNGDECTATNLCATIIRVLEMRNLSVDNIACITTDGASVMTGVRGGVTTLMKERNGLMLSVHCIAHRLALASGQAANSNKYLQQYQAMINTVYKYYHYSPKHQAKMNKIQQVYEMAERKFKQTFPTRWLSFEGAVEAIIENYAALVACMEMDVAECGDPVASGILRFISDYRFLYSTHAMMDVITELGILSRNFQRRDLTVSEQSSQLSAAICALKAMRTSPGPSLS
ncbi:zinc finger protein 862-like [Dreissena polymorpha]|uniref:zinc finger protein 862-like n=1 Tax=Dreissena polymorpha TaxID=45954 RepID=UPI0022654120|nr:zinc finger protein 862-like [Dreissena polymorpha]XP_052281125.1 zinc finger protein 862-like [Dreissena polymorpha]